jgi:hypothetical protein
MTITYDTGNHVLYLDGTETYTFNDVYSTSEASGWSLISRGSGNNHYYVSSYLVIGDGATVTTFNSLNESVYFADGFYLAVSPLSVLNLGALVSGWAVSGSFFRMKAADAYLIADNNANINIYGSHIHNESLTNPITFSNGNVVIYNSILEGANPTVEGFVFGNLLDTMILKDVFYTTCKSFKVNVNPTNIENVQIHNTANGIYLGLPSATVTISGLKITAASSYDAYTVQSNSTLNIINPVNHIVASKNDSSTGKIYEQYTVDINICDYSGNNLSGVAVACTGVNNGGFITITSDVSGNITQQVLNYKLWSGSTPTLVSYSPYTFTFSKSGYRTMTYNNITVDHPLVWHVEMPEIGAPVGRSIIGLVSRRIY